MYTTLIRKNKLEYVAVCLDLNIAARGSNLADVEKNLKSAIEAYIEDITEYPETVVASISTEELIEFLKDTEQNRLEEGNFMRPLEVHEVPMYV